MTSAFSFPLSHTPTPFNPSRWVTGRVPVGVLSLRLAVYRSDRAGTVLVYVYVYVYEHHLFGHGDGAGAPGVEGHCLRRKGAPGRVCGVCLIAIVVQFRVCSRGCWSDGVQYNMAIGV